MKGYKYNRYIQSWHWSQDVGETLIYIPESKAALYEGGHSGQSYKGITTDAKFIDEAEEYVSKIKDGTVKKYINQEHEDYIERFDQKRQYSNEVMIARDRIYAYEIPEKKEGNTIFRAIYLSKFEEVEIDITPEGIKEIVDEQNKFIINKSAFEMEKKRFEENISNINKLIKK